MSLLAGDLFQRLFDAAALGIAVADLEGRVLEVNPALCSMLGFSGEELRSKRWAELSPQQDANKDCALFEQLRHGSTDNYHVDKRFVRKDGALLWGRLSVSSANHHEGTTPLVVATVQDITENKKTEEELRRLASRLIQAQEEERHRIGRELHDDIGQRLVLLSMCLEQLRDALAAGQNSESLLVSELHRKTVELATEIHNLSHDLHASKLALLGLHPALRNLCEKISAQQHLRITLHLEELPANLPSDLELCIFRVAQEALNNIVKHSHAPQAFVKLSHAKNTAVLKIRDLGIGFDPSAPHGGIGFSSMRERLRMFGGELLVESIPGKGTTIIAKVQL